MRILITNLQLTGRSGTEMYVRDLALGLLRRGHQPVVYSPALGEQADELRRERIPVVDDLNAIDESPDLIHGHHNVTTMTALLHFSDAPAVFVCHDRLAHTDAAPLHSRVYRYIAVDSNCRERLVSECGIPESKVSVVYNWVDVARFQPRDQLPQNPSRALIFSGYLGHVQMDLICRTCDSAGLTVERIGTGPEDLTDQPERVLKNYDVVFAKARSALEAMAVGSAVILMGYDRMGPLVSRANVEELRKWNFGRRVITELITPGNLLQEIRRYDSHDAEQVSRWVRSEASMEKGLDDLTEIYEGAMETHRGVPPLTLQVEMRQAARGLRDLENHVALLTAQQSKMQARLQELEILTPTSPLTLEECKHISLDPIDVPARAAAGSRVVFRVRIHNQSDRTLCSLPPYEVNLAGTWLKDSVPLTEGSRARLIFPLIGKSTGIYTMVLAAPDLPGRYTLHITLVQEYILWLDTLGVESLWSDHSILIEPAIVPCA